MIGFKTHELYLSPSKIDDLKCTGILNEVQYMLCDQLFRADDDVYRYRVV